VHANACTSERFFHDAQHMSAKPSRKSGNKPARAAAPAGSAASTSSPIPAAVVQETATAPVSWMDSPDPRKRIWGKILFVAVWVYVAALWLLALDQTFHWGIFGPKVPPVP
jgi:hypothetical protein